MKLGENKMKNNTIIYSLNIEDVQTVAIQELDRSLSIKEIEKIKATIAEQINWYDAIAYSINEKLENL
jgi:uncharacterized protein YcfL